MRFFIVLFLLANSIGLTASAAASKDHRQAAEELLEVTNLKSSMGLMINQMVELQLQQRPNMRPYRAVFLEFFSKYLGYDNIKHDFINIYTEEFTKQELRKLTEFYRSPVGQKTITKMPVLMQKGAQIGMSKVKTHQAELQQMLQAEQKRLQPSQQAPVKK